MPQHLRVMGIDLVPRVGHVAGREGNGASGAADIHIVSSTREGHVSRRDARVIQVPGWLYRRNFLLWKVEDYAT